MVVYCNKHLNVHLNDLYTTGMCPQWSAVVGTSPHSDKIALTQAKIATTISRNLI